MLCMSPLAYLSTIEDDPAFCFNVAKDLILRKVNVNAKNGSDTPLFHLASHAKFKEITKLLLLNGAVTKHYSQQEIENEKQYSTSQDAERMKVQPKNIEDAIQELHIEIPVIVWIQDDETGVLSQIVRDVRLVIVQYFSGLI